MTISDIEVQGLVFGIKGFDVFGKKRVFTADRAATDLEVLQPDF
jgi:hypothetical protein